MLRWGADPSGGAPYVFTDPANPDRYIGYEKEMVDALAQAMGRRAEFVPSDWQTLVSALQRNSFDVIVNGLEPTGDRARQILFSKPYYIFQLQLTVRADDNRINSLADCKNRVVGTLANTAENLESFIRHPRAVVPHTAMPELGVSEEEARDITAYLYAVR